MKSSNESNKKKPLGETGKKTLIPATKPALVKSKRDKEDENQIIDHLALSADALTDNFEKDLDTEAAAMKAMLRESDKKFADSFGARNDTEYWCVLTFPDRRMKNAFLEFLGWNQFGDKYINGLRVAAWEGIELPPPMATEETPRPKKRFSELVDDDLDKRSPHDGEVQTPRAASEED